MEALNDLASGRSHAHKCFCQLMLSRRMLKVQDAGNIFKALCFQLGKIEQDVVLSPPQLREIVDSLIRTNNDELRDLGLRFQLSHDEFNDTTSGYVVLVSDRSHSKILASLSGMLPDEITLFQMWLQLMYDGVAVRGNDTTRMMRAANANGEGDEDSSLAEWPHYAGQFGELRVTDAMANVGTATGNYARKVLKKLVDMRWIVQHGPTNTIRLSLTTLAELSSVLKASYTLPQCRLCKHTIYVGRLAYKCACDGHTHARCIKRYWSTALPMMCPFEGCDEWIEDSIMDKFLFDPVEEAGQMASMEILNGDGDDDTRSTANGYSRTTHSKGHSTAKSNGTMNGSSKRASSKNTSKRGSRGTSTAALQGSTTYNSTSASSINGQQMTSGLVLGRSSRPAEQSRPGNSTSHTRPSLSSALRHASAMQVSNESGSEDEIRPTSSKRAAVKAASRSRGRPEVATAGRDERRHHRRRPTPEQQREIVRRLAGGRQAERSGESSEGELEESPPMKKRGRGKIAQSDPISRRRRPTPEQQREMVRRLATGQRTEGGGELGARQQAKKKSREKGRIPQLGHKSCRRAVLEDDSSDHQNSDASTMEDYDVSPLDSEVEQEGDGEGVSSDSTLDDRDVSSPEELENDEGEEDEE